MDDTLCRQKAPIRRRIGGMYLPHREKKDKERDKEVL
jgi:hypothetical protein